MNNRLLSLFGCALLASTLSLSAQSFISPAFTGVTSFDGWGGFNSTNLPGYGSHPGTTAWPTPVESNEAGSGNATLNKVSGSGYMSTNAAQSYIYSTLSGAQAANASPANVVGTFSLTDTTPVSGLETVLFQIQISYWANVGQAFPTGVLPTLTYTYLNEFSQPVSLTLDSTYSLLIYRGSFVSEYGSGTADTWGFQWDLSSVTQPITSFSINYSVTNHAQTYALRLDQSDTFVQAVPEPSTIAFVVLGLAFLAFKARRFVRTSVA